MEYDKNYYEERRKEFQQDALRLKLRHSDKVYQLSVELDQDIRNLNQKIEELGIKEKQSLKNEPKPEPEPEKK